MTEATHSPSRPGIQKGAPTELRPRRSTGGSVTEFKLPIAAPAVSQASGQRSKIEWIGDRDHAETTGDDVRKSPGAECRHRVELGVPNGDQLTIGLDLEEDRAWLHRQR